tara:strand:+ start:422 stop:637 length:216 start_codon:yes stop_codon:yes gene_type:complete
MGYMNQTKKELISIIEGQLDDIKELEAENDELWKLLDDIKESESITFAVLDKTKPMTLEDIAMTIMKPIDE